MKVTVVSVPHQISGLQSHCSHSPLTAHESPLTACHTTIRQCRSFSPLPSLSLSLSLLHTASPPTAMAALPSPLSLSASKRQIAEQCATYEAFCSHKQRLGVGRQDKS